MNHTSSTTFSIPTQTDNVEWKIQDGDDDTNNQYTLKTDSDIQIDVGNNSGITTDGSMGTISLEPDPEKMEELEELSETQSEKLNELRDQIIDYIASNDLARGDIEQWKRDLATIDDYRRQVDGQD